MVVRAKIIIITQNAKLHNHKNTTSSLSTLTVESTGKCKIK